MTLPAAIPGSRVIGLEEPVCSGPLLLSYHGSMLTPFAVPQTYRVDLVLCIRKAIWD